MNHSVKCLAQAVISAVENFRDEEVWTDSLGRDLRKAQPISVGEFRTRILDDTLLSTADGYLADGLQTCTCAERVLAWTLKDDAELSGVQPEDLVSIATLIAESQGATYEEARAGSLLISMTDEWGWSHGQPVVMWEEGNHEWAYQMPETVKQYLEARGLRVEAVRTWMVGVYVD